MNSHYGRTTRPRHRLGAFFSLWMAVMIVSGSQISLQVAPALAGPAEAPLAQTNTLHLQVVSARTEPDHPGGPVTQGDPITQYKFLINVDNTGNPSQPYGAGCSPGNPGYPDSCDWPSIRAVPAAAPIFTQGDETILNGSTGINLPDGKYLVSVMAEGYKIGGAHFIVPLQGAITVELQPHPLPAATMRIKVFEDISSTNGQFDAPAEHGLAGFRVAINDILGLVSTDVFGNPLCTTYDPGG
ncbi:MAG TPA: hypothetical protein VJ436_05950, partial [Anaerolineales bacterium]|nr:hypothetical protein [Anaerolineales bacterium]